MQIEDRSVWMFPWICVILKWVPFVMALRVCLGGEDIG